LRLGVAFGWHTLPFEALLELVRLAEELGYEVAYLDGDVSLLPSRGDDDVLDGWTLTTALAMRTERIVITSIRLPHFWNAARLAHAAATLERIAPGRLRLLAGVGGHPNDRRFGLPWRPARERVAWLEELLVALRALLAGETVHTQGRYVQLDGARIRPVPARPIPLHVAAAGPRAVGVAARLADGWDINLPPLPERVEPAERTFAKACRAAGRDPGAIERSMWLFFRPGASPEDPAIREAYRRYNPWFSDVPDADLPRVMVAGSPAGCRARIAELRADLSLDLPVLDLSGLGRDAARQALLVAAPPETLVDSTI